MQHPPSSHALTFSASVCVFQNPWSDVSAQEKSTPWRLVERLAASTGGFGVWVGDLKARFHQPLDVIYLGPS
jgi:hypothetical protein